MEPSEHDRAVDVAAAALAPTWRFPAATLRGCLTRSVVAHQDGAIVGVCAMFADGDKQALNLVAVSSEHRRRGVGRQLVGKALEELRRAGTHAVTAAGGGSYLWPGVPSDAVGAHELLNSLGWREVGVVYDLTRSLVGYSSPPEVLRRAADADVTFGCANAAERKYLVAIAPDHWPAGWDKYFAESRTSDIVVGRVRGDVIAALIISRPESGSGWRLMLGDNACTIGCVGTLNTARGKGIGTALVALASELLRDAGGGTCHIGWTTLLAFYGQVGYQPWRRYTTMRRDND